MTTRCKHTKAERGELRWVIRWQDGDYLKPSRTGSPRWASRQRLAGRFTFTGAKSRLDAEWFCEPGEPRPARLVYLRPRGKAAPVATTQPADLPTITVSAFREAWSEYRDGAVLGEEIDGWIDAGLSGIPMAVGGRTVHLIPDPPAEVSVWYEEHNRRGFWSFDWKCVNGGYGTTDRAKAEAFVERAPDNVRSYYFVRPYPALSPTAPTAPSRVRMTVTIEAPSEIAAWSMLRGVGSSASVAVDGRNVDGSTYRISTERVGS